MLMFSIVWLLFVIALTAFLIKKLPNKTPTYVFTGLSVGIVIILTFVAIAVVARSL